MALIKLNIDSLKKDTKGILNRLVDNVVNKIEDKLENAVEGLIAGGLKKIGLSSSIASEISSRFGDAFSKGNADKYFKEFNSEVKRMTPDEIRQNMFSSGDAETYSDAVVRASDRRAVSDARATMQFPSNIGKYFMSMKFAEYQRPAPEARATLEFQQAFVLPVPRELKEQIAINVDDGATQGQIGGLANLGATMFGTDQAGTALRDQAGAMLYSLAVQKIGEMESSVGQVLGQFMGAVPNPHVQAIFSGIPLRTHRFDWTFSPRNRQESQELQKLIFTLKAYSLPSYTRLGTAALQYPMLCQINMYPWDDNSDVNNRLMVFKPAILRNVDINYSPQGMPAFFEGTNLPTMVSFSLEFVETEIHTSNDYKRQGDSNLDRQSETIVNTIDAAGLALGLSTPISQEFKTFTDTLNGN